MPSVSPCSKEEYSGGPSDGVVFRINLSSPSSITKLEPPSLLTKALGILYSSFPTGPCFAPERLSIGPGVDIPKTELGISLLALDVVIPLISSNSKP